MTNRGLLVDDPQNNSSDSEEVNRNINLENLPISRFASPMASFVAANATIITKGSKTLSRIPQIKETPKQPRRSDLVHPTGAQLVNPYRDCTISPAERQMRESIMLESHGFMNETEPGKYTHD